MERGCKETMSWTDYTSVPAESLCQEPITFLWAWSNAVLSMIDKYGHVIQKYSYEIHYLDFGNVPQYDSTSGSPVLPASYIVTKGRTLREQLSEICAVNKHINSVKIEPCRQLQLKVKGLGPGLTLLYDSTREVYFTADVEGRNSTEVLWVQE